MSDNWSIKQNKDGFKLSYNWGLYDWEISADTKNIEKTYNYPYPIAVPENCILKTKDISGKEVIIPLDPVGLTTAISRFGREFVDNYTSPKTPDEARQKAS